MASLTSSMNTSLPPSSINNTTTLREASFCSHLGNSDEKSIRNLIESSQSPSVFKQNRQQNSRQNKAEDGEIDVFSADKYFNKGLTETPYNTNSTLSRSTKYQTLEMNHEDPAEVNNMGQSNNKLKLVRSRTPSSSQSERSANSQSALLKRFHRTPSRISTNTETNRKFQGAGKFSFFTCSCCDKKSVEIDPKLTDHVDKFSEVPLGPGYSKAGTIPRSIKTSLDAAEITRMNKLRVLDNTDQFVYPILNSPSLTAIEKVQDEGEDTRKSLDVFGSSDFDEGSKRFSLQKRLNMLAWDTIPRAEESNTSGAPSETYKDAESDASSDLFEIECLSCTANPVMQSPRLVPSDGSVTPTSRYAPSEASIEWSVVTASAADFSFDSDSEDQRSTTLRSTRHKMGLKMNTSMKSSVNKDVHKPVSSNMLGCQSQKSVNVAREVHRKTPPRGKSETQRMQKVPESFAPVTRFQAETKLGGFGHKQRQRQSFSPDNLLYIQ
ncbi:unnamed protein product [Amaranthus hypochondriacus]